MSNNTVKNQHYVSQFILKKFANDKQQVYESLLNKGRVYPTNINRSMSSKFIYEHKDLTKNTLEDHFSKIEGYVAPMLDKLIDILEGREKEIHEAFNIVKQIMPELLVFYYRSGALLHEYSTHYGKFTDEEKIELLIEKIIDSKYLKSLSSTILNNYEWAIIQSDNNNFIVSEQYISTVALSIKSRFINKTNRNMGLKDVMILIPISSKYYFVFYHGKKPFFIHSQQLCLLNESQTNEVNVAILNNSYYKCVSLKEDALRKVLPEFNISSPSGAIAQHSSGYTQFKLKKEVFYYKDDELSFEFFTSFRFLKYKDIKRNDLCICDSQVKYKKCCLKYVEESERLLNEIQRNVNPLTYSANMESVIEQSIDEIFTYDEPEILKDVEESKNRDT